MDFSKLGKARKSSEPGTLLELFDQLDRKASHNSLRPVQIEALIGLQSQIAKRDVLLKVSTGSGKTVVGLVFAEFMRRRYPGEPVVYLCPTRQLIEQVLQGAAAIGVNAEAYPPEGVPLDGFAGKSVLICTYDRLFNARSTFNSRSIVPSTLILDDVHAGTDRIRQKYTVSVPAATYDRIRGIFRPICEASDPAIWRGIETTNTTLAMKYRSGCGYRTRKLSRSFSNPSTRIPPYSTGETLRVMPNTRAYAFRESRPSYHCRWQRWKRTPPTVRPSIGSLCRRVSRMARPPLRT